MRRTSSCRHLRPVASGPISAGETAGPPLRDAEMRVLVAVAHLARDLGPHTYVDTQAVHSRVRGYPALDLAAVAEALAMLACFGLLECRGGIMVPPDPTTPYRLTVAGCRELIRRDISAERAAAIT
jgi:hypothetical protein